MRFLHGRADGRRRAFIQVTHAAGEARCADGDSATNSSVGPHLVPEGKVSPHRGVARTFSGQMRPATAKQKGERHQDIGSRQNTLSRRMSGAVSVAARRGSVRGGEMADEMIGRRNHRERQACRTRVTMPDRGK